MMRIFISFTSHFLKICKQFANKGKGVLFYHFNYCQLQDNEISRNNSSSRTSTKHSLFIAKWQCYSCPTSGYIQGIVTSLTSIFFTFSTSLALSNTNYCVWLQLIDLKQFTFCALQPTNPWSILGAEGVTSCVTPAVHVFCRLTRLHAWGRAVEYNASSWQSRKLFRRQRVEDGFVAEWHRDVTRTELQGTNHWCEESHVHTLF